MISSLNYYIETGIILTDTFIYIMISSFVSFSDSTDKYTLCTSLFLNLYIIAILIIFTIQVLKPSLVNSFMNNNFKFLRTNKGKAIFLFAISLLFFGSENMSQVVLSIIFFLSAVFLFILDRICVLNDINEEIKKENEQAVKSVSTFDESKEGNQITGSKENNNTNNNNKIQNNNPYDVSEDF